MKKIILLSAFVFYLGSGVQAQGDGIQFETAPWAEILAKAAAEDKVIFVDAYTDWCGPCKKMTRDVFSRKEIADYYNATFVNVKMNMEKGEGPALAQKYKVKAYPTLLFLDGDGSVVHRAVGYHDSDNFMQLGNTAAVPGNRLSDLDKRYEFGDRSGKFLYDYTFARAEAMDGSHLKIAEEYLATEKDWGLERNLTFLFRFLETTDGKMFDYFVDNKQKFVDIFGETPVARKMQYLINSSIQDSVTENAVTQVERLYKKVYPQRAAELTSEYKMMYYLRAGDIPKYTDAAESHYKQFGTNDWESLNETAWNYFENADGKKDLKKAVKWAKKSVALDSNYYNTDTLAALYYKLGKHKKAIAAAENAITLAKQSGDDYTGTAEMLEMLRKL